MDRDGAGIELAASGSNGSSRGVDQFETTRIVYSPLDEVEYPCQSR